LITEHNKSKRQLEIQVKEALQLIETTKAQSETEKATLEAQYRDKLALLQAEHQLEAESHAKSNDDATERMQKEIETVQLAWQEEQKKLIAAHEASIQALKKEHAAAIDSLEQVNYLFSAKKKKLFVDSVFCTNVD
jgi:broad specificity phosphatase PhoE